MRGLASVGLLSLLSGCHLVGGPSYFIEPVPSESGVGGSGGATSASSVSASSGASSSSSTSSTGGGGPACDLEPCKQTDLRCQTPVCVSKTECGLVPLARGTVCDENLGLRCDGKGKCLLCLEDVDCKDSSAPYCAVDSGLCVACVDDTPCKIKSPDLECIQFTCVTELCKNTSQDMSNGESDIDCGGKCSPCAPGKKCVLASDCASKLCEGGICGCTESGQCPNGNYCDVPQKTCVPKKNNGASCTSPDQCKTETCSTSFTCWFEPCCH